MAARLEKVAAQLSSSPAAGSAGKDTNATVAPRLLAAAQKMGLDVAGGKIRRTSSRFCLGVEHGDYNGTELFGVGTDRYIWSACALFSVFIVLSLERRRPLGSSHTHSTHNSFFIFVVSPPPPSLPPSQTSRTGLA